MREGREGIKRETEEERGPDMPCNGGASFFKAFAVRCLQDTSTSCAEQGSGFIKVIAGSSLPCPSLTSPSLSNADEDDDDRLGR